MNQDEMKKAVAEAAINYSIPKLHSDSILGIGTGSTANYFIDMLAEHRSKFAATVASSEASAERLQSHGIKVLDLNDVDRIQIYVDGADETNPNLQLIKGGGAALTREKIVASASDEFVCIVDESKWVDTLGSFPLPVEVIPMAANKVVAALKNLRGAPKVRENVVTDNGNLIVDVAGLKIDHPTKLETEINQIVGVVTNGLFANRPADVLMMSTPTEVKIFGNQNT